VSRSLVGTACGLLTRSRSRYATFHTLSAAAICLAAAGPASARRADVANPCQILPPSAIAAAFGVAHAPASTETTVTNVSTCSFKAGLLTISIGNTALTNPAAPLSTAKVAGIPSGLYETFGAKASQLTFNKGGAATGIYVVIRNGNQASDPQHRFYSEAGAGDLTQVFSQIGFSLSSARLISDTAS
jgi:hypothetical protein